MTKNKKDITIIGAGLVGSLLSIYLSKKGYKVSVYEKRADPRKTLLDDGRSINLALSHRGIKALKGAGIEKEILNHAIPMDGRMIHDLKGNTVFQPYGENGQCIYSVSRGELNRLLIDEAGKNKLVKISFEEKCLSVDIRKKKVSFENAVDKKISSIDYDLIIGGDGAFSPVREALQETAGFESDIDKLSHGYIELNIPAGVNGTFLLEKNALHIWPREQFMLIALPNPNGSFTCTLFLFFEGDNSFSSIKNEAEAIAFFTKYFPDALALMPDFKKDFFAAKPSFLSTVHCFPWHYEDTLMIIGDAAHAIVPFYGQGMNAGFEDIRILSDLLDNCEQDWEKTLEEYQNLRKPNGDAIAALAMQNFIEMRDLVGDKEFLLRKKIEARLHQEFKEFLPLYSMVTFSDIPYAEALAKGKEHDVVMKKIMQLENIEQEWQTEEGWQKIRSVFLDKN